MHHKLDQTPEEPLLDHFAEWFERAVEASRIKGSYHPSLNVWQTELVENRNGRLRKCLAVVYESTLTVELIHP